MSGFTGPAELISAALKQLDLWAGSLLGRLHGHFGLPYGGYVGPAPYEPVITSDIRMADCAACYEPVHDGPCLALLFPGTKPFEVVISDN